MTETPHSPYGYWIDPAGEIYALEKSMAHAEWLSGSGHYRELDSVDAIETALLDGWISLSVSPVGESIGVRIRRGSAEKNAVRALGRIFKEDGMWEKELYTDFASWTGRTLYNHLVRTGCNSKIFPDKKAEIHFVETEIVERLLDVAYLEAVAEAQAEGNVPDFERAGKLVSDIENLCGQAYDHIEKIGSFGKGISDLEQMHRYCREQISVFYRYSTELRSVIDDLTFAFAGTANRVVADCPDVLAEVDRSLSDVEIIEHLKIIHLDLRTRPSATSIHVGFDKVSQDLGKAYGIVDKIETATGLLVTSKLKLLEKALLDENATAESIASSAGYYIGHELARTFSVARRYYTRELYEQLKLARETFLPTVRP